MQCCMETVVITLLDLHNFHHYDWFVPGFCMINPGIILMMPVQFGMQNLCSTLLNQPKNMLVDFCVGFTWLTLCNFDSHHRFASLHCTCFHFLSCPFIHVLLILIHVLPLQLLSSHLFVLNLHECMKKRSGVSTEVATHGNKGKGPGKFY